MTFTTDQAASTSGQISSWDRYAQAIGRARPEYEGAFPDFLVIAPPRSGTTWLYENLRQHPELYLPEVKEVRYFDTEWRRYDINWYLGHFASAGNRIKGEVSPPYVLLPDDAIRLIKGFNPRLKLVMLFRHPVKRAWSHISHAFKWFESPYEKRTGAFAEAGIEAYLKGLLADYTVLTSNYGAILSRWLAHFPPEQFFISSLEDAVREPADYFSRLYDFLGVEARNSSIIRTRINAEVDWSANSPPRLFTDYANVLFAESTRDTRAILEQKFGIQLNWEMRDEIAANPADPAVAGHSTVAPGENSASSVPIDATRKSVCAVEPECGTTTGWMELIRFRATGVGKSGDRVLLQNAMAALWHTKMAEWRHLGQGTDFNVFYTAPRYCVVRKRWGKPDFNLPMGELELLYPKGDFFIAESRGAIFAILHLPGFLKKCRPIAVAYDTIRSLLKRIA
jgi:hypothetical protein